MGIPLYLAKQEPVQNPFLALIVGLDTDVKSQFFAYWVVSIARSDFLDR